MAANIPDERINIPQLNLGFLVSSSFSVEVTAVCADWERSVCVCMCGSGLKIHFYTAVVM